MITPENKVIFTKRLKSLAWRLSMVFVIALLDFVITNLGLFSLPNEITVVLGLMLGEVSKYLNSTYQLAKK